MVCNSSITSRKPTHKESVEIMLRALTDQQRRENLAYWRKYGDEFVNRVAAEAERKRK